MTTSTLTAQATIRTNAAAGRAGFMDTLASEWAKLSSLRSTPIILGLGVGLSIGTTALGAIAFGASGNDWPDQFDPTLFSMVGNIFALIVFSVFGVLVASREYSNGAVGLTLVATPNRRHVFLAKLTLVNAIVMTAGLVSTIGMFLVGQGVLAAYGLPSTSLANGDARVVVFGLGLAMPFFPTVGLALGFLLRSTAGGITTVLGILWLPQIFGQFMPMWSREHIISLLPGSAVDSITVGHLAESPDYSNPALAAVVAAAWLVAIAGAAYTAFLTKDA